MVRSTAMTRPGTRLRSRSSSAASTDRYPLLRRTVDPTHAHPPVASRHGGLGQRARPAPVMTPVGRLFPPKSGCRGGGRRSPWWPPLPLPESFWRYWNLVMAEPPSPGTVHDSVACPSPGDADMSVMASGTAKS